MAEKVTRQMQGRQLFALTLLLATPSSLQAVWIQSKNENDWRAVLQDLGFTEVDAAVDFMGRLSNRRPFFEGLASLLQEHGEYPEPPPHPTPDVARDIVQRLK